MLNNRLLSKKNQKRTKYCAILGLDNTHTISLVIYLYPIIYYVSMLQSHPQFKVSNALKHSFDGTHHDASRGGKGRVMLAALAASVAVCGSIYLYQTWTSTSTLSDDGRSVGKTATVAAGADAIAAAPQTSGKATVWRWLHRFSKTEEDDGEDAFTIGPNGGLKLFHSNEGSPLQKPSSWQRQTALKSSDVASGSGEKVKATAVFPPDIEEREAQIKVIRALLNRVSDITYDDDNSGDDLSDETDVSLNYHIATVMEGDARDALLEAFDAHEAYRENLMLSDSAMAEADIEEQSLSNAVLLGILEYLDLSNEREKLRARRVALYFNEGREAPISSSGEEEDEMVGLEKDFQSYMQSASQLAMQDARHFLPGMGEDGNCDPLQVLFEQQYSSLSSGKPALQAGFGFNGGAMEETALDRLLRQDATKRSPQRALEVDDDMMESDWEDDDGDFSGYLQPSNTAAPFAGRLGTQRTRQSRCVSSDNAIRVVDANGRDFKQGVESENDNAGLREEEEEDEEWEEEAESLDLSAPHWSRAEKRVFEASLFERIGLLAEAWNMTSTMAVMEIDREDAGKLAGRGERRRKKGSEALAAFAEVELMQDEAEARGVIGSEDDDDCDWTDEDDLE